MKKAKLISLIALSPIGVVTPIVVTSCSNYQSPINKVQYGDTYTIKSNDRSVAKSVASIHIDIYDEQKSCTWEQCASKCPTTLTPQEFYWELMYAMGNSGTDFSLLSWSTNGSNMTFNYKIGSAESSVNNQTATYFENNGKVWFKIT